MRYATARDRTIEKEYRVACRSCQQETRHQVVASIDRDWHDDDHRGTEEYQIIQCQGCDSISYRENWYADYDVEVDEDGQLQYPDHFEVYPPRVAGRTRLHGDYYLPEQVGAIYRETYNALTSDQPILAGVGIRALIEAVCHDSGATGRTLQKKIDNLVEKKVATKAAAKILHSLRILGNRSAHQVKPESPTLLADSFDVVEHLLTGL